MPKILPDDVPMRTTVRDTQLVERLVEVPTIISYSSLQRTVEQHVDIPVPGGGGSISGLQGFSSGQSSTALPSKKRISERIVEQIVDPVCRGGHHGSLSGHGSSSSHSPAGVEERTDEPGKGVFRTFPQNKKQCEVGFALESEGARQWEPIHAGGSARAGLVVGVTHPCSAGRAGGGQGCREKGAGGAQEEAEEEKKEVMTCQRALVSGSHLFFVFLPEGNSCRFSGDSFRIRRIQCFLVRQWTQVISGLRRLLYSNPATDSRPALQFCVDNGIGIWAGFCWRQCTSRHVHFFGYRIQRTAWSSVVHVMRQSTEW